MFKIKKYKKILLTCLIFFSLIYLCFPSSSAGFIDRLDKAYALRPQIEIFYDEEAAFDPILPLDMIKNIPIEINYRVDGLYESDIVGYVEDVSIFMELFIAETPDWCNATISPSFLKVYPSLDWYSQNATVKVKIYENAPAEKLGKIKLKLKLQGFGTVKGGIIESNITFTAGFLPILKIKSLSGNSRLISPGEYANFELEIENLGNAITDVETEVLNAPKDWIVGVDSSIMLKTKIIDPNNKQTVNINIVPPNNFGYHQETQVINIKFTPKYFNDSSVNGSEYFVSFMVKSKGFSTPGFDIILVIISVSLFLFLFKLKKSKNSGGKR